MLSAGAASHAAIVASDTFESYTAGSTIVGQQAPTGGGTGWISEWKSNANLTLANATNVTVQAPGAPYADGQRAEVLASAGNGGTAFRGLSAAMADVAGNTYYLSYDAQNTSGGTRFFGVALLSGAVEKQLLGQASGQSNWTLNGIANPPNNNADSGINTSAAAHLLMKIVFGGAGSAESVSFWVNPDLSQTEDSAANNAHLVGTFTTSSDFGSIDRFRIGGGATSAAGDFAAHWIDNLLVTTDAPFSVPEPASLSLGAVGATVCLLRRRPRTL
jgi:hypothetical protein